MDVIPAGSDAVNVGRKQRGAGLDRDGSRSSRNDGPAPEEAHVDPRPLLQVTEQRDNTVAPQRIGYGPDGGASQRDHVQPEALSRIDHRIVQGAGKALGYSED